MTNVPLEQLTFQKFAELLRSRFCVHSGPASVVELELLEATSDEGRENFSLVFSGPSDCPLAQQIYRFEHPKVGGFDLFIVPISREQGCFRYEAIFNRSLPRQSK